jgi:hypothetical protein
VDKDKRRGERRDQSWRYAKRALGIHLSWLHADGVLDCPCERSVWLFRKRKAIDCGCRAKKKGAPKLPGGMCSTGEGDYRDTVRERIAGRRLAREWLRRLGAAAPLDIDL